MRIAVIKEGKIPSDSRVPLTPKQCRYIIDHTDHEIVVQSSEVRCIKDEEYIDEGIDVVKHIHDADVLIGVKEVPTEQLVDGKIYFFFSHTIKEQIYNRKLMKALIKKNIWMIDYETLTDANGKRVIAFGKYAGMVGAHNALYTYSQRTGLFNLKRMKDQFSYQEVKEDYAKTTFPAVKIVLTGTGRVGNGAALVLRDMGISQVSPEDFLNNTYAKPVFTQLDIKHYYKKKDDSEFVAQDFYRNPSEYRSIFEPYTKVADILIQGIYWDPEAPKFFTSEEMAKDDFNIKVIADITCDIAPDSSIPSTLRPSTISNPIYGYNPRARSETTPFKESNIDIMAIDNLPNELPRDASEAFGNMFIEHVLPELSNINQSEMLRRATITKDGKLGDEFQYLTEYAFGI